MATTEDRRGGREGRVEPLMDILATQLETMDERISGVQQRLNDLHASLRLWVVVTASLHAAELAALIAIALALARR
jgi:hypothetical protein